MQLLLVRVFILQLVISNIFSLLRASFYSLSLLLPLAQNLDVCSVNQCPVWLTGTWPLMMTSSAKRTLTGLVFNLAFLAALMNADLGDFWRGKKKERRRGRKKKRHFKGLSVSVKMTHACFQLHTIQRHVPSLKHGNIPCLHYVLMPLRGLCVRAQEGRHPHCRCVTGAAKKTNSEWRQLQAGL